MILDLWNYFKGYVVIEVTGFSVERFVNLAVHRGVYIWDVKNDGSSVKMKVSINGFKTLRECARKTKCKYRIVEKKGYPFVTYKYRKRKLFMYGTLFFVAFLYVLSSFVWVVQVEGNERIEASKILLFCEERGLKSGALKRNIDKKALEQELIINFKDISFLNIGIKGTKAVITLTETLPAKEIVDRSIPTNIIAVKDGLIDSIVASGGTPLVKAKDVVSQGDILISGEVVVKEDETGTIKEYVHAGGSVRARTFYEMNFTVPKTYYQKQYTGEIKKFYRFNVLNKDINILKPSIPYDNYDKIISRKQIGIGEILPLPAIIITDEYKEFISVEKQRDLNQMLELSQIIISNRIIREFAFEADVIDKNIQYEETADGLRIKAVITCLEEIGKAVPYFDSISEPAL